MATTALDAFNADLSRLADLTDDELSTLENNIMSAFDNADQANDEESMNALADALDQVRAEKDKRASAAPAAPTADTSAPAPDASAPAPAADGSVAASAASTIDNQEQESTVDIPKGRAPKTTEAPASHISIVAAGDLQGISAGAEFPSLEKFAESFADRINRVNRLTGGDGERVIVASMKSEVSEDRILKLSDPEGNRDKIEAVINPAAITASGGYCAPLATRYDLFTIGETARPVRDSLAGFQAERGGIRYFTPPTLASVALSTGIWDSTKDAAYNAADTATWKVMGDVACPAEQTAMTEAVTMSIKFGVISSRVFPENAAANTQLALVQHARIAESNLLAKIKAGSTLMAGPAVQYGVTRDILLTIARAAAWYRDRNRLTQDVTLRAILPLWIVDAMRADVIVQPPAGDGRTADFDISRTDIENFFDAWNVNITWALDGADPATNLGGTYADLVDTVSTTDPTGTKDLPAFPTSVEWALYAEGSWLFLDGGTLDLGIVRDSQLVRSNDYIQFSESFENAVRLGAQNQSLWFTSPLSVLGAYSKSIA